MKLRETAVGAKIEGTRRLKGQEFLGKRSEAPDSHKLLLWEFSNLQGLGKLSYEIWAAEEQVESRTLPPRRGHPL